MYRLGTRKIERRENPVHRKTVRKSRRNDQLFPHHCGANKQADGSALGGEARHHDKRGDSAEIQRGAAAVEVVCCSTGRDKASQVAWTQDQDRCDLPLRYAAGASTTRRALGKRKAAGANSPGK